MTVILAARRAVEQPSAFEVPTAPYKPYQQPSVDRMTIDLLGVNGDVIRLTGGRGGLHVSSDSPPYGFWIGPYDSQTEPTPGVDGARYGDIRAAERPVGLTLNYEFESVPQRRVFADRLVRALNPKNGLAGFLVTEPDNTSRMITGRFVGSMQQWAVERDRGTWSIDLDAADEPYWMDAPGSELVEQTWKAPIPVDYLPYLPIVMGADVAFGDPVRVNNNGHDEAYGDWVLRGPATRALIINDTTGEALEWEGNLTGTGWIAFITKPGMQEVVDSSGNSRFHELSQEPEPAFWSFAEGPNSIRTIIEGTDERTSMSLMPLGRRWMIQG